jgi:rRNA maturation protein Nop10
MTNNESGNLQDLAAALQDEGSNRPTQAEVAAKAKLPWYRSHKVVEAVRIHSIMARGEGGLSLLGSVDLGHSGYGVEVMVDAAYVAKHQPKTGGYYVRYEDGYESWSPADAFEGGYTAVAAAGPESTTRYTLTDEVRRRFENTFTYHPPKGDQAQRYTELRDLAKNLALVGVQLSPPGREQSLALTKLEEAAFWFNAAIARGE